MVNRSNKRSGTSFRGRGQGVTVTRSFLLGSMPAGNGSYQFSSVLAVYPDEETLVPIARSYSEYKFVKFEVSLQPRCSTTTQGSKWLGFGYSVPFVPQDYAAASALGKFDSTTAYLTVGRSRLQPSNSAQRWYPIYQNALTSVQLADPNIVQAYLYLGSQGVQSGVVPADIHVKYTIHMRGPVAPTAAIGPASIPTIETHLPLADAQVDLDLDSE
jgi:hypothetical protein